MKLLGRLAVVGVLFLSACGDSGSGVSAGAGKVLNAQVDALRATAARDDRAAATQHLVLLRASVEKLQSDGELSESATARIRRSLDAVESQLTRLTPPTTTTTTTTTIPPSDDEDEKGNGRGRDNGKGKDEDD